MNESADDIKNLVAQIQQLTAENERLKRGGAPSIATIDDAVDDEVATEASLVGSYPDSEFKNLTRSTIALLAFWREAQARLQSLAECLDAPDLINAVITPEFPTPSPGGKASFTDLLVESTRTAVAIEGKRTEGRYPTVDKWCMSDNRRRVLDHWLSLIRRRANVPSEARVGSLVYQMVHRVASVCARPAERAIVLYQLFGRDHVAEYEADLKALVTAIQPTTNLEVWLQVVPTEETSEYAAIAARLAGLSDIQRAATIKRAIVNGSLFRFSDASPRRITA